ncbi:MAG: YqgE/AlgH family protein [Planctomycetes bacterium]|nr:YqgE/AlgH family protein [Planctomycetota bacterium]
MESHQGKLLIASPSLLDPNFHRTVTLLVEHDENGALGLVLNRPTQISVMDLWSKVSEGGCPYRGLIYHGGPCPGAIFALHTDADCSQAELPDGVHFTADREHLNRLMGSAEEPIRFFLGYAGWGAGQMESEFAQESWMTLEADRARVFGTSPRAWVDLLRKIEPLQAAQIMRRELMDADPSMN